MERSCVSKEWEWVETAAEKREKFIFMDETFCTIISQNGEIMCFFQGVALEWGWGMRWGGRDTVHWNRDPIKLCVCLRAQRVTSQARKGSRRWWTACLPSLKNIALAVVPASAAKLWHILRPFLFRLRLRYWHFLLLFSSFSSPQTVFSFSSPFVSRRPRPESQI